MRYRVGDIVVITKSGIHQDDKANITEVNPLQIPNTNYYTVELYKKKIRIIVNEEDIKPYRLTDNKKTKKTDCVCGGDFLSIPHHYEWCPKGAKNV
jgi:hypothetical protein